MLPSQPTREAPAVVGRAWAWLLLLALLAGLGSLTALRWRELPGSSSTIVELPVQPADLAPEHVQLSAPDPGDAP